MRGVYKMGKMLHNLGLMCFKLKWWVVGFWLFVLIVAGAGAAIFYKAPSSDVSIPGTEAQVALDRLTELFPGAGKASGNIVFHTTDKQVSDFKSEIEDTLFRVKGADGVTSVVSPFINPQAISSDGKTAYAIVQLEGETGQIDEATLDRIGEITSSLSDQGLQVERGGALTNAGVGDVLGITEILGVILAFVVLLITFGALIPAGMPLVVALLSVGISVTGLFALSQIIEVSWTAPVLSIMLGLAVGIDYSLFTISKYRSLLLEGYSNSAAAGRAIGTAGNAVIFAAATVVIALAALSVVGIPFLTTMGLVGAASIALAAVVAITLTPALFGIAGARMFGRKTSAAIATAQATAQGNGHGAAREVSTSTFWQRWGQALTKRPIMAALVVIIIVGFLAIPVPSLALSLPSDQYAAPSTTQRKAYDLLTDAFGVGYNAPLIAVVGNVPPVTEADREAARAVVMAAVQQQQQQAGAQNLDPQQQQLAQVLLEAQITQYANLSELNKIAAQLAEAPNVQSATAARVTADGANGIIQIIPESAPSDRATTDLIMYLRDNQAAATGSPDVSLAITGATALERDISKKLSDALPIYLIVVVGLSLVLLLIAFRSILIPITATLGFLLSVLAMFGSMVAIFGQGLFGFATPGPLVSFLPIIGIGILFGLAMDYEFFLVSSMHEVYAKTGDPKRAIEIGFSHGAPVVAAAAAIMVCVFAGFIGNASPIIQGMSFGLAVGIFVDAFLVRMTLIPSVMTLLGKAAWWLPKWLDKALPNIPIEGEAEEAV
jgi:RND superfamily putative drug exporter